MPPLRTRTPDIPLLADYFIRRYAAANGRTIEGLTPEALAGLMASPWPGNVRELEHALERAVILARGPVLEAGLFQGLPIAAAAAPANQGNGLPVPGSTMDQIERDVILRTMESVGGSVRRAADILQISPRTIQYKLKRYRATPLSDRPSQS
jgi:two-component system NtrC family response regulator/two-component system response regulator HydG